MLNSYVEFPAVTKDGREVWLGPERVDRARRQGAVHRHAGGGPRHHRAPAAPSTRCAPPRRSTAPSSSSRSSASTSCRTSAWSTSIRRAPTSSATREQELLDLPWAFALLHDQDRALVVDQLARLGVAGAVERAADVRGMRKDGTLVQVEAFCTVTEFGDQPAILATVIDISDRVKLEDQLRQAQKMEAVGPPGRRHRPRLQQPAHRHSRQRGADVASRQGRSGDGRRGRRDSARRRSRRLADPPVAAVQPQAGAAAGGARPQRDRGQRGADGAPPDRRRRAAAPRAGPDGGAGARRSRADRTGPAQPDRQRPRCHAERRPHPR